MGKQFLQITAITAVLACLLVGIHQLTGERISANRTAAEWRMARAMTNNPTLSGPWQHNALPLEDDRWLRRVSAPGYSGPIQLLVLLEADTRIAALRVVRHSETPGIGDFIEDHDQAWMRALTGISSDRPDTVTGATVTSRAVLAALDEAQRQQQAVTP